MNNKVYEEITNKIIAQLNQGIIPWEQPWIYTGGAVSYATGRRYSLLNQMVLGGASGEYLTWNQIQQHKAHLKKGSTGHRVFFWNTFDQVKTNDAGEKEIKKIPYLKTYTVFAVDDCVGIQRRWAPQKACTNTITPIKNAEDVANKYLQREHIELRHTNPNAAYYSVSHDYINMPPINCFKSPEQYAAVLFHESTHSTGSRLGRFKRNDSSAPYGSPNYSREELIAEMGASFMLRHLNIDNAQTLRQNAAYIQSWIRALKNDFSLVAIAASKSEKAVQFILGND